MPKFKVGDKVRFIGDYKNHVREAQLKEVYNNNEILEISDITCTGHYMVKEQPKWVFNEEELELIEEIKIGDTVQPKSCCIGYPDYFRIVGAKHEYGCNISYDLEQLTFNGKTLTEMQLQNWQKTDFNVVPSINHPMDIVIQQVLADIKGEKLYKMYVDGKFENVIEKGEDKMKILEIYKERTLKEIENNYDKLIKDVLAEDNVQKIIKETENQLNVLLDRPEERKISLGCEYLFEPKTQEKIEKLKEERKQAEDKVEKLIEEVKARLEICDDNEISKVAVLKEYGILDKDGRIAEYKIEKKGRK